LVDGLFALVMVVRMRKMATQWALARAGLMASTLVLLPFGVAHANSDRPELQELPELGIKRDPFAAAPPVRDVPDIPAALDVTDADAALEGIRIALSEVADGGTYVWHRRDGRLSGMAQPTGSFKDKSGQPCRHLIVMLNSPARSRKVEGIACQMADRRWELTG
jgi:hypothetical protein